MGLDLFDSPHTLAAVLGKLVESYALDAIDAANEAQAATPEPPRPWLATIAATRVDPFAAIGEGEDWRLIGDGLTGGALVKDGRIVHLCAFRIATRDGRPGTTRIHRSFRSRRHTGSLD